jgi:hypothetical protein
VVERQSLAEEKHMTGNSRYSLGPAFAAVLGLAQIFGCGGPPDDSSLDESALAAQKAKKNKDAIKACGLDDGSMGHDDELRACDAGNTKKTTICHVPPGNPANAHTICIGNPAVGPHQHHHGDYIGPCKVETPCPPPGGSGGSSGNPGTGGTPGGEGGSPGSGGTPGTGGSPAPMCDMGRISCGPTGQVPADGCPDGTACTGGCCWRLVE